MKKVAMLLTAALLVMSLAGCGKTDKENKETTAAQGETMGNEETSIQTVTPGVLTMGTNAAFPPYEFYEGDEIVGIDAEIAAAVAEKLGLTLKIEDMEFGSIITSIQTNKIDIGLAGMTVTEDRLVNVNFSSTYATGVQVVIVKEGSEIQSVDDLAGKKIGVQENTTGHIYCSDDYGEDNVVAYTAGANAVEALKTGKVDCVVIDNEPAKAFVAANTGLVILDTEYITEDYAAAINKTNTGLLDAVNKALAELKADGTLDKIITKYIPAE